jgi:hypothetical protein
VVSADGVGVVSHAGSRLLADLADRSSLTGQLSDALALLRRPRAVHDPGQVLADLAVSIADGGDCISDIAVLGDQSALFGPVASDSTVWRLLDQLDTDQLAAVAGARAAAREVVWAQRAEVTGAVFPPARAAGRDLPGLVIDLDATIVICHSEKQAAAPTFKGTFGYHPMLAYLDNTGEALAGLLRPGNAGANTAADHIAVLDAALTQIPDEHRHGTAILIRTDGAGCSKAFLTHIRRLRQDGVASEFSVGWAITDRERAAITAVPEHIWTAAIDTDGETRDRAAVAEITDLLPAGTLADYPTGTRIIVRRERPHPGAQLSLFEETDGWRYTAFATDTPIGAVGLSRRPAPRPRPGRRPDPDRQRHRPRPIPLPRPGHQHRLAHRRHDRRRPPRLDPNPAPARRPRPRRAQEAALPAPARRRPAHPRRTPTPAPHRPTLALGRRPDHRVHPTRRTSRPDHLTHHTRPDEHPRRTRHRTGRANHHDRHRTEPDNHSARLSDQSHE